MKIAIVGAGPTGLMAGYDLVKAGHQVCIFEKEADYGGLVSTIQVGKGRVERFYHHVFTGDSEFIALAKELDLTAHLRWQTPCNGIYLNNQLHPFTSPLDLLLFPELNFWERVVMGLLVCRARRLVDWRELENITAKEWIINQASVEVYEKIWEPLLRSKFAEEAAGISAAWIWNKFKQRGSTRSRNLQRELLGYLDGSFMILYDRLAQEIEKGGGEIFLGEAVQGIESQKDQTLVVSSGIRRAEFDRVIVTLPPQILPKLCLALPETYRRQLKDLRYQANICLLLELERPLSSYYWITVAQEDAPFVAIIEHTNLVSDAGYGGHIVYLSRYLRADDQLYIAADARVKEIFLNNLRKVFPEWDDSWVRGSRIYRSTYAQPIMTTGYSRRMPPYWTPVPNLYLASMAQIYPEDRGQNYALRSGREVARVVQEI